jgi:sulfur-carrier protein
MSIKIRIPSQLRSLTNGHSEVRTEPAEGATLRDVLGQLDARHPGIGARVLDDDGRLRRFVNVFVADDDVRFLEGLDTVVANGATVSIVPAVAGG